MPLCKELMWLRHGCLSGFRGCHLEDTSLDDILSLIATGPFGHKFNGTVANKVTVLNWSSHQRLVQRKRTEIPIC